MTTDEKMRLIEESLELEPNSLKEDTRLEDVKEFDSMARLSLIVLCDDEFNKELSGEQINDFHTVGDVVRFMG